MTFIRLNWGSDGACTSIRVAIRAFNVEIGKAADKSKDSKLVQIRFVEDHHLVSCSELKGLLSIDGCVRSRLQWWRGAVESFDEGSPPYHPVTYIGMHCFLLGACDRISMCRRRSWIRSVRRTTATSWTPTSSSPSLIIVSRQISTPLTQTHCTAPPMQPSTSPCASSHPSTCSPSCVALPMHAAAY